MAFPASLLQLITGNTPAKMTQEERAEAMTVNHQERPFEQVAEIVHKLRGNEVVR